MRELIEKEQMLVETCVRMVLLDLMERNEISQKEFEGILYNINTGVFGKREYRFDDISWINNLENLRVILSKINPVYSDKEKTGDWYRLPEEKKRLG